MHATKKIAKLIRSIETKEGVPIATLLHLDPAAVEDASSFTVCILNLGNEPNPCDVASITHLLHSFAGFERLKVSKGKSYSFADFRSFADAVAARDALDSALFVAAASPAEAQLVPVWAATSSVKARLDASGRTLHACLARYCPFPETDTLTEPADILSCIPGLHIINNFVSKEEERFLIEGMNRHPWVPLSERQVQHHGFVFDYDSNHIDFVKEPGPLPVWCQFLIERMNSKLRELTLQYPNDFDYRGFNQLTLNRYPPGSGISPHVDTHTRFDSPITSVSLLAPVQMEWRTLYHSTPPTSKGTPQPQHKTIHIQLQPRSVCFMAGPSRFAWEHAIRARKADVVNAARVDRELRISLTFRGVRVREEECVCACSWESLCDARIAGGAKPDRFKDIDELVTQEGKVNRHGIIIEDKKV